MPALHHGGAAEESAPPCACCHNLGDPSAFDPPYNFTSIKKTNALQAIHPPMCRGYVEKPFMGMNSYSSPYLNLQNGFHTIHSENSPVKPRIVTVVKPGTSALRKITLLLNRRSVQTFEQLIADISEALGFPRWKNDRVRKLYNLKGKEIGGISDFFRGDDVFIAMGLEPLTMNSIEMVTEELYPNGQCLHSTIKKHWRLAERAIGQSIDQSLKVDSGFEGSDISKDCCKAKSPRLAVRHEDKTQHKVRPTEAVRVKKWDREKWHRQQGKPPEKLEKYPANSKNIKGKFEDRSLNDMVVCEQCRKERQSRHKLHSERPADVLLDVPNYNTGNCARYTLERKQKITSCKKPTGSPIAGYEFDRSGKVCTSHRKPICDYPKDLQKQHNEENLLDDSVEERNNHERHCIHIKNGTVEPQHNTTEGRTETEKQRESFCKMRAICKLSEDCQVDAQEPIKIRLEENMQGTQSNRVDNNIINTKSDLNGAYKNGGFKGTMERREQQQCSDTGPRLLECRADVENYYEIGRIIGDGNFAIVKECRVRNVNQQYAMKIIDKSKLKGKEDMIENEISIIKGLSHPNIVRLLDEYETDTEIFLIMEYVRGGDLFDAIIESVRFTEHDAALMMADLCEALVYIHCRNIVHRDLKPENLLIQHNPDKSTTLKLADFGLAVHVTEPIFTVCGTPTYVAPEILLEKGYGLEVDMWATGVILYILLCGFPPFRSPERDQEHLFQIIQFGQYEFTSPYWDRISDEAKDLISKLLVVDPKWRFTAKQVLHHHWISSDGKKNSRNLQREVTMNIERHFQNRRRAEALTTDQ